MSKTRFTKGMVLVCIATVAACTSTGSDEGPPGNTELNVVLPDPESTDVQSVEYTICCDGSGTTDGYLDNDLNFDDAVCINGNVEVIEDPAGIPGSDLTNAEVRQGYMDLAPGACTVELRARDNDGEVICTDKDGFVVSNGGTTTVNQTLFCGLSFQADVGNAIVIADFSYNVANFCPDLIVLNCLESMPTAPEGQFAETVCEVRYRDGDSDCGESCDPQTCTPVLDGPGGQASGLDCQPAASPGVSTDITCDAGTITTCTNGTIHSDGSCHFDGDQLGSLFANTNGNQVVPNPATFEVSCEGAGPGTTIRCTAETTDGDLDCNKTKFVDFSCPGLTQCGTFGENNNQTPDQAGGDAACEVLADTVCTVDTCDNNSCDGTTEAACCVNTAVDDNPPVDCSDEITEPIGACEGGVCTSQSCELDTDCNPAIANPCTEPRSCDQASGFCCAQPGTCTSDEAPEPVAGNPDCTTAGVSDGYCDGAGACTPYECRVASEATDCTDNNGCTTDACDDAVLGGSCSNTNLADGTDCTDVTDGKCFVVPPETVSECFGSECTPTTVDDDCTAVTSCTADPVCDTSVNPGGVCVYPAFPQGTRCPTTQDPVSCISGFCGECDGAGTCDEKPASCDPVFRDIVTCQSRELLALDCQLLGSGAPLVLDATATPAGAAVQGVPLDINPQLVLNLPASLVCGFASVVPEANVFDSIANLNLVNSVPSAFPLNSFLGSIPHGPVNFDFNVGCGNQAGACVGGLCNDTAVECTTATEKTDCSGTGKGVIVPFISTTAPDTITPDASASIVSLQYSVADLGAWVEVPALTATLCLGDLATVEDSPTDQCSFTCIDSDRTDSGNIGGDDSPRVIYDVDCDKITIAACGGTECPNGLDAECPLAQAGQTCNTAVNLCNPVNEANSNLGGSDFCVGATEGTCDIPAGVACLEDSDCAAPSSVNASGGTCVGEAPGVCPDTVTPCAKNRDCWPFSESQGIPVCCGDKPAGGAFHDFSQAANVCSTGEPGSALADTEAPCNGSEDPRSQRGKVCRGVATCGSCTPVTGTGDGMPAGLGSWPTAIDTCSAVIGFGEAGYCSGTAALSFFLCPNGDSDCRNADGTGIGGLGEDYCVVPCATCDAADCCQYMQDRFPTATTAQFPLIPVNPAP